MIGSPLAARATCAIAVACVVAVLAPASGAVAADVLIVGPGKFGSLRMGATTQKAKRQGWIARDHHCGGVWTGGPRAYRIKGPSGSAVEVFKGGPALMSQGRLLSMWAMGKVETSKGVRAQGLAQDSHRGSTLATVRDAYPGLKRAGRWQPDVPYEPDTIIYSTGSSKNAWLDFYVDTASRRVWMMLVRTNDVGPLAFKGVEGC